MSLSPSDWCSGLENIFCRPSTGVYEDIIGIFYSLCKIFCVCNNEYYTVVVYVYNLQIVYEHTYVENAS